jgi:hypothetical protein
MNKMSWPQACIIFAGVISTGLLIGVSVWDFYHYGLMGGQGFLVPFNWMELTVLWLIHLSYWIVLIGGSIWLVRTTCRRS